MKSEDWNATIEQIALGYALHELIGPNDQAHFLQYASGGRHSMATLAHAYLRQADAAELAAYELKATNPVESARIDGIATWALKVTALIATKTTQSGRARSGRRWRSAVLATMLGCHGAAEIIDGWQKGIHKSRLQQELFNRLFASYRRSIAAGEADVVELLAKYPGEAEYIVKTAADIYDVKSFRARHGLKSRGPLPRGFAGRDQMRLEAKAHTAAAAALRAR